VIFQHALHQLLVAEEFNSLQAMMPRDKNAQFDLAVSLRNMGRACRCQSEGLSEHDSSCPIAGVIAENIAGHYRPQVSLLLADLGAEVTEILAVQNRSDCKHVDKFYRCR